jgi:hypothetical protein
MKYTQDAYTIRDENNDLICDLYKYEHGRLIAAAPDMLAALQDCLALLQDPDADGFSADAMELKIEEILKRTISE